METFDEVSTEESDHRRMLIEERRRQHLLESRLGIPFALRLPLATSFGFITGAALGLGHGTKVAAMRFRAENSHRFPQSSTGWYLYHKSKNYCTALGGVKEGAKMGWKIGVWTAAFFTVENIFDIWRGEKDFINTVAGGLAVAGGFCWSNSLPAPTAARTAKLSLVAGLTFGIAQDVLRYVKGRHLGYIDFFSRKKSENP
ncbi:hypothetical protein GcM3_059030 [Golovinomyces cichoracearum]|uniref:Uncharacterized protein n=1 Tax=Golovinomyces cichoracearum TaxID=62708 RepID=A0A420IWZ4_9PEZI|nr:hypothetical protein GcM3_059030 [Golovinomyces cichoracearum]